ncbi:MAG: cation:proton antiporter [Thermodesulfobacteriota bacterium]
MEMITSRDVVVLLTALGVLLITARLLAEISRHLHLTTVFGEILAGILLGPTVLGTAAPEICATLFPQAGPGALLFEGIITLSLVLFLLVAGLEADISTVWRQGKAVVSMGVSGIFFPSAVGFAAAWFFPVLLGRKAGADPLIFSLFIATALSISALPVIAKTLMELDLYRSDLGMMIIAAAIFNDLIGWIIFAVILGLMGKGGSHLPLAWTILLTFGFTFLMITFFRRLIHGILPWIQAHTVWPGGQLGFTLSMTLLGAAFTEWIGVHAIFGSFMVGVAMGDTPHFRERMRAIIDQFVSYFFAPIFFASIGLKLNFAAFFDLRMILLVLIIACLGKIMGCIIGGRLSGMSPREAWAVGFGMNARGAMEIVLGLMALRYGIISEHLFVALIVMAVVTSLMSGPMMQWILRLRKPRRFSDFLPARGMIRLRSRDADAAIAELAEALGTVDGVASRDVTEAAQKRENLMPTGIGNEVAAPHARLDGISQPLVALGISQTGIDFQGPDGNPARFVFLILTPTHDNGAQVEILSDIARTFRRRDFREAVLAANGITEFLALVKSYGVTR